MKITIRGVVFLSYLLLLSCKSKPEDKTLNIYHLAPDDVIIRSDKSVSQGWYAMERHDFFAVKNFDLENDEHKISIDCFIVDYIKEDSFLYKNKNALWALTFFKYGDDINERTMHVYDTDYTMFNLFAPEKEICSFYFDTRIGYSGSFYSVEHDPKKLDNSAREIIAEYFIDIRLPKYQQP